METDDKEYSDYTETGTSMDMPNLGTKSKKEFFDELTKIAARQLAVSNKFKEPLLAKWKEFDDLNAGKRKKMLRSQFNVVLPVYSGMIDTLAADFDEPVELEFKKKNPADYFKAKKIQAAWNIQKNDSDRDAMWDYKSRVDKRINIRYGRSILKYFAFSDPKYHSVLQNTAPQYFHCQPKGGGILENHLFAQEENIFKTQAELQSGADNGLYDKEQWKDLKIKAANKDYQTDVTDNHTEKMSRFRAIGLDAESNNYIGETMYNLCEAILTYKNKRYYILYDPFTVTWIRGERLTDIFSADLYPWKSWATHEDDLVFWNFGYGDILYPIADSIITLFNQELTNREKRNMNARAYDEEMFTDFAKLDAAQYRPDALVPFDSKGGTRKAADGIYTFTTAELQGTITLLDWIDDKSQKSTGVTDISQGASVDATKKVNVAFMEQASVAKRIGFKSQSYTECWGQVGKLFKQGLNDHMTEDMYIEMIGDMGIEPDVLTKEDADTESELDVAVVSSTARKQEAAAKKSGKVKALELVAQSQNVNSEWKDASILRYVGDFDEEEIRLAMDTKNFASRESVSKAHIAIQELLGKEQPEFNYAADPVFLKTILDYSMDHRNKLGKERFKKFAQYIAMHVQAATKNAKQAGATRGMQMGRAQNMAAAQNPKGRVVNKNTPAPAPEAVQMQ